MDDTYAQRALDACHPSLEQRDRDAFVELIEQRPDDTPRLEKLLTWVDRLSGNAHVKRILVIGCGPQPDAVRILSARGFEVLGVEPVASLVESANRFLGSTRVLKGAAESIPVGDGSQDLVLFESVLEHVDSPSLALREIHRVLAPGGILSLVTTNRWQIDWRGRNGEYSIPFFNWFPRAVQESYVFQQLHYRPQLANYSTRPAVHWFSYPDLCALGREAGFAHFYSFVDLLRPEDPGVARSAFRRKLVWHLQRHAWLRALALTQWGGNLFMTKRRS